MEGLNNKLYKKGWTSEEVRRLKSLYDGGLSSEEIACNLDRTKSSIYKAIARFNLTHKNRRGGYDPEKDTYQTNVIHETYNRFFPLKLALPGYRLRQPRYRRLHSQ